MAPLSFLWVYGNLSAYMDSYFRFSCYPKCADCDTQWILALYVAGGCPGSLLTKILVKRWGLKWSGIFAMVTCGAAMFVSVWTLQQSVAWTVVLYGVFFGQAVGVNLSVNYQIVGGWAPNKLALFMATVTGTPAMLSVIQNQLITAYVNPKNLKANAYVGPRTYFSQPEILNRVPMAVMLYAAMTFGLQLVGYFLITNPPQPSSAEPMSRNPIASSRKNDGTVTASRPTKASDILSPYNGIREETNGHKVKTYGSNNVNNETSNVLKNYKSVTSAIKLDDNSTRDFAEPEMATASLTEDEPKSCKPSETVKTPVFYALVLFGTSILYGLVYKSNYYKQFALLYINDDKYLTLIGTLIPIVSTASRILFGTCLDKDLMSIKDAVILSLSLHTVLCSLWYFAPQVNAIVYLVLILCLAGTQSMYYLIIPTAAFRIFGAEHFSTNFGLLLILNILIGILTPVVATPVLGILGWFWLFTSVSILNLFTLIVVIFTDFDIFSSDKGKC
ncbi:oxalate:formate antiporter-like isoform x1 [Plakobranchus ocellatus]|uniref:Oxalate:formate antiporter-like isoform x1 n=1 Tax=Plakobranchus ocellatus TaxID=259542 RepID=A0AAV4DI06_9GAST|nr:oxalate:formate antiporter-like isoform x1 [Plakobranchus ocellatus]